MANDSDRKNLVIVDEASGITRWAPLAVVVSVVGGFVALSWYAYHAGMQSVREDDLVVVEADKTPIKEKPVDPGGMHFPNQDKTIFETFSSSGKQPPKVERVLPAPEEPLSKEVESNETSTYVNDKLHKNSMDMAKKPAIQPKAPPATDRQVIAAQNTAEEDQSVTYVAPRASSPSQALDNAVKTNLTDKRGQPFAPEKLITESPKPTAKDKMREKAKEEAERSEAVHVEQVKAGQKTAEMAQVEKEVGDEDVPAKYTTSVNAPPKEATAKNVKDVTVQDIKTSNTATAAREAKKADEPRAAATESKPAAGGKSVIQLGAYRSEEEAQAQWNKMHLKQKELSDKKPTIIRADLGAKGIYYRLRVTGLASGSEAKSICNALAAKRQACIIVSGN